MKSISNILNLSCIDKIETTLYILHSFTKIPSLTDSDGYRFFQVRLFTEGELLNFLIEIILCSFPFDSVCIGKYIIDWNKDIFEVIKGRMYKSTIDKMLCANESVIVTTSFSEVHANKQIQSLVDMIRRGMDAKNITTSYSEIFHSQILDEGGDIYVVDVNKLINVIKEKWTWILENNYHLPSGIDRVLMDVVSSDGKDIFEKIIVIRGDNIRSTEEIVYDD